MLKKLSTIRIIGRRLGGMGLLALVMALLIAVGAEARYGAPNGAAQSKQTAVGIGAAEPTAVDVDAALRALAATGKANRKAVSRQATSQAGTASPGTLFLFLDPSSQEYVLARYEPGFGDQVGGTVLSNIPAEYTRPSVTGDGAIAYFVSATADVCNVPTDGSAETSCSGVEGSIYSAAVSPDFNSLAYLRLDQDGNPIPTIRIVDLNGVKETIVFDLPNINVNQATAAVPLYAESMSFTNDSGILVYDVRYLVTLQDGSQGSAFGIFQTELTTLQTTTLVQPTVGGGAIYPSLEHGAKGAEAAVVYAVLSPTGGSGNVSPGTGFDVFLGVLANGQTSVQAVPPANSQPLRLVSGPGLGLPSFTGDDQSITYVQQDDTVPTGSSVYIRPLAQTQQQDLQTIYIPDASHPVGYMAIIVSSSASGTGSSSSGGNVSGGSSNVIPGNILDIPSGGARSRDIINP